MKKLFFLSLILILPILCFAQDKTYVNFGGIGIMTMDDNASHYKFGGGYFISVSQQVAPNLMIGVSYAAGKVIGKDVDFSAITSQQASATSTYFFKPIDTTSKFNIFLKTSGGWVKLKDGSGSDNGVTGLFGGGLTYNFYEGIRLTAELTITNFSDNMTAFCPSAGLSFPFSL